MQPISRFHQFAMLVLLCMVLIGGPSAGAATPSPANAPQDINEPLNIPQVATTPKIDGVCDRQEYVNVTPLAFSDAFGGGEVFLMHDGSALYVCMQTAGSQFSRTFASIYLDKGAKRADIATDSDYSLVRPRDPASPQRGLRGGILIRRLPFAPRLILIDPGAEFLSGEIGEGEQCIADVALRIDGDDVAGDRDAAARQVAGLRFAPIAKSAPAAITASARSLVK